MTSFTSSPAWRALLEHRDALAGASLESLWRDDPGRGAALTAGCAGIAVDFSKQRITPETVRLLVALARERGLPAAIARRITSPSRRRCAPMSAANRIETSRAGATRLTGVKTIAVSTRM